MPTFDTAFAFFAASVLLALVPGPDNVFVLLHSAVHGRRAGMLVVLGLCTGLLGHTTAVALGLAAVFAASQSAFVALKFVGSTYLAYLAWQAFRAPVSVGGKDAAPVLRPAQLFLRGMLMNLTNPKVVIFFLAFLPQFANPALGSVAPQIMLLGIVFMLATLLVFGAIAVFSGTFGTLLLRSARAQRWLNRAAGVVFLGLAVRLATISRAAT